MNRNEGMNVYLPHNNITKTINNKSKVIIIYVGKRDEYILQ